MIYPLLTELAVVFRLNISLHVHAFLAATVTPYLRAQPHLKLAFHGTLRSAMAGSIASRHPPETDGAELPRGLLRRAIHPMTEFGGLSVRRTMTARYAHSMADDKIAAVGRLEFARVC